VELNTNILNEREKPARLGFYTHFAVKQHKTGGEHFVRCADYSNLLQFILDFWQGPLFRKRHCISAKTVV
jgi:hypothetical protein